MALKPNQIQLTSHKSQPTSNKQQASTIIEQVHKNVNDILRSFDLENENLEQDNPFDY
jgi:hypothetical protein